MWQRLFRTAAVLGLLLAGGPSIAADKDCAVVLMHGKWGNVRNISFFGDKLRAACDYQSIEMPWSQRRNYDAPYPAALAEIKTQVDAFRKQGYKRVLVAGHSFGANAALAYMAEIGDADGIIALAPGHSPAFMYQRGIGREAVDQARQLVEEGKGSEKVTMEDLNQGRRQTIRMPAEILFSYFDPKGLGHMPSSAARMKKAVPFIWVIGTGDPLYPAGTAYAFDKAPPHPASKYLVVQADHAGTPDVAGGDVLAWIQGLPD